MFDAVLFDLDGTLTDPEVGIVGSFRHALTTVGHPPADDADLRWMIGPPIRANLLDYGLPEHLHDDAVEAYRQRHLATGLYEATLHPGIVDLLVDLGTAGVDVAVATLKPPLQATRTLAHFGLDALVQVTAGAGPAALHDKRVIVADALTRLGRGGGAGVDGRANGRSDGRGAAGRVAMVGDRAQDVDGGRFNGCTTVGVTWGFAPPGELEAAAPDHLVDTVADLRTLLLGT